MVKSFLRTIRAAALLRLIPALAWIAVQVSMAAMPVAAHEVSHDAEVAALFETFGVDRIVLCTPDGKQVLEKHDDHAAHDGCPWCQGFSVTLIPDAPEHATPVEFSSTTAWAANASAGLSPIQQQACHPGRAPPDAI